MKYISLLALAALFLSACAEKPAVYPFRVILLQSVPHTDTDMRRVSFSHDEINPTDGRQMPVIIFEGNGNFTLESEWDGSFNQDDTLSLNSSSDKVRLNLHVALTANTMTSIKVVFDAADKLRCETVK